MSSIDALSIRGVRSFSPDSSQVIKFGKPLTVIVGENGCGKTTIIECLKYATTGSLPPGSGTGASFVHDPKIAGRTEVKAQIKLKFKNRVPQTMVCVRDLQVTQHKSKSTFKALECVLQVHDYAADGTTHKRSATHACMKMDTLMPDMIGVPKAVLEHVVFCHQEESNWPLQEGAKLKERFDAIFEASRYTKALEDIRKVRKDQAALAKDADNNAVVQQVHVNTLTGLRQKLNQLSSQSAVAEAERTAEDLEIQETEELVRAAKRQQEAVAEIRRQLEAARAHTKAAEDNQRTIETEIRRLPSVEATEANRLRKLSRKEFDQEVIHLDRNLATVEVQYTERLNTISNLRNEEQQIGRKILNVTASLSDRIAARKTVTSLETEFTSYATSVAREHVRFNALSLNVNPSSSSSGSHTQGVASSGDSGTTLPLTLQSQGSGTSSASGSALVTSSLTTVDLNFRAPFTIAQAEGFIGRITSARSIANRELGTYRSKEGETLKEAKRRAADLASNVTRLNATQEGIVSELKRVRTDIQTTEYDVNSLTSSSSSASRLATIGMNLTGPADKILQTLQHEATRTSAELDAYTSGSHNPAETAQALAKLGGDIDTYNRALQLVRRSYNALVAQSALRAEIDVLRNTAKENESRAHAKLREESHRLSRLFPHTIELPADKLDEFIHQNLNGLRQEIKTMEIQFKQAEQRYDRNRNEKNRAQRTLVDDLVSMKRILTTVQEKAKGYFLSLHRNDHVQRLRNLVELGNDNHPSTATGHLLREMDEHSLASLPTDELLGYVPPPPEPYGFTLANWEEYFVGPLRAELKTEEDLLAGRESYKEFFARGIDFLNLTGACQMCDRKVPGGADGDEGQTIQAHIHKLIADEDARTNEEGRNRETEQALVDYLRGVLQWAEAVSVMAKEYDTAYHRVLQTGAEIRTLANDTADAMRTVDILRGRLEELRTREIETVGVESAVTDAVKFRNEATIARRRADEKEGTLSTTASTFTGNDPTDLRNAGVTIFNDMNNASAITLDSLNAVILQLEAKITDARNHTATLNNLVQDRTKRQLALQTKLAEIQTALAATQAAETKLATVRGRLGDLQKRQYELEKQVNDGIAALRSAEAETAVATASAKQIEDAYFSNVTNLERRYATYDTAYSRCTGLLDRIKKTRIEAGIDTDGGSHEMTTLVSSSSSSSGTNFNDIENQLEGLKQNQTKIQDDIKRMEQENEVSGKTLRTLSATKAVLSIVNRLYDANDAIERNKRSEENLREKLKAILEEVRSNENLLAKADDFFGTHVSGKKRNRREEDAEDDREDGDDKDDGGRRHRSGNTDIDLTGTDEEKDGNDGDTQPRKKKSRSSERYAEFSSALTDANDPLGALDRQANYFEQMLAERLQAKARLDGRLDQLKLSMESTRTEMKTKKELHNCEKRYKDAVIEATLLDSVVQDLDMYHKALDTALMRFHKLKIAEINAVIRDLWSNTYHGADIDNIEIRSDLEEESGATVLASTTASTGTGVTSKGSKSYNYRVVMRKGDAELDMRGRCSAGQKVLASIVIRLALAESFCVNTGILALDEPTTNLDPPNKKGLASSLARLIELRAGANLQLIVITHDEDFVRELGSAMEGGGGSNSVNQLGVYYRVSREEVLGRPGVYHSFIEHLEL